MEERVCNYLIGMLVGVAWFLKVWFFVALPFLIGYCWKLYLDHKYGKVLHPLSKNNPKNK